MSEQNPIPASTSGIYVAGGELDLTAKPSYVPDGAYFTIAASENDEERGYVRWLGDETVVTDNYMLAVTWAYVRLSHADDGNNPMPVAKIVAHREDPFEVQRDDDEGAEIEDDDVVVYVTGAGTFGRDDAEYEQIAAMTFEWSEITKFQANG